MRSALLCTCLLALGCSAVVNPDETRLGDPPEDSGIVLTDTGIRLMDSGPLPDGAPPPPVEDAGPPPVEDSGPPVTCDGPARCDGDTLVSCSEAGLEERRNCADEESFCEGAACNARNCEPGASRCGSGFAAFECDERGVGEVRMGCARGCDFETGRCRGDDPPPATCEDVESIALGGDDEVDLCERANGTSYVGGDDCGGGSDADTGEQVYRLEIEAPTSVEVEVYDIDEFSAVDTVVYIRRMCDETGSQIACSDDVPCAESDFPGGPRCVGEGEGVEVRQSILRRRLEPGTYFVFVDGHDYERGGVRYSCGEVRVEVRAVDGG